MMKRRAVAAVVAAAATSLVLAACSSGGSSSSSSSASGSSSGSGSRSNTNASSSVTLTWWNNATNQPLLGVYQSAIKAFEAANPGVTITDVPIQNEQLKTKIPLALDGSNAPNIYQQWGGGDLATQLKSGKVGDITSDVSSWISEIGNAATGWANSGKQYGAPVDLHVVGFWYRKDLFTKAGISSPPTTIAQLESDDKALRAQGIAPIAVGSKDQWPDAFWWEYFALRECPMATIQASMSGVNLSDACYGKASTDLANFLNSNPFQTGFLGTSAQQGAGSSAGLVASGKAAMELQGDWDPSVMEGVASNPNLKSELGWFPFPGVTGGAGSQSAVLGGGDGFSCTGNAAQLKACSDFLQYLDTPAVQAQLVGPASVGLPANPAAASSVTLPAEQTASAAFKGADYVALYFDQALPTQPGLHLDTALANYFAKPSSGTAAAIPSSITAP